MIGTPSYIPVEQLLAKKKITSAADVFSLSVVLAHSIFRVMMGGDESRRRGQAGRHHDGGVQPHGETLPKLDAEEREEAEQDLGIPGPSKIFSEATIKIVNCVTTVEISNSDLEIINC